MFVNLSLADAAIDLLAIQLSSIQFLLDVFNFYFFIIIIVITLQFTHVSGWGGGEGGGGLAFCPFKVSCPQALLLFFF